MRERLEKIIEQLKALNERVGRKNRTIIIIVLIIAVVTIGIIVKLTGNVGYEVLYTGLSDEEQVEILGVIQELGVGTKSTDSGEIDVPEGQADSVRAQLAVQGYPKSGMSYDVFTNNVSMTSTEFEKETYKIYELQDRLASTIKYFEGVRDATVTIAMAQSSDYALNSSADSEGQTTASVTVIMKDGGSPSSEQVAGIRKLVASSVPGMDAKNVTVIDGNGNEVSDSPDSSSGTGDSVTLSALKVKLEQQAENSIRAKVLNLLEPVYGNDKVKVSVNCKVDVQKEISEAVTYYPSQTGDNSGVRSGESLDWSSAGTGTAAQGVTGTEANSEVPVYPYTADGTNGQYYTDKRTYDYLVSKLTDQIESNDSDISDTNVSVVIDSGTLTQNEIAGIRDLVAVTSGISADNAAAKVAIMDTNFAKAEDNGTADTLMSRITSAGPLLYIIGGAVLLILLMVIVGVSRMRARKKRERAQIELLEAEEDDEDSYQDERAPAQEKTKEPEFTVEPIDLVDIQDTKAQLLREQIREFTIQNPEIAASLIKNWLREEEK